MQLGGGWCRSPGLICVAVPDSLRWSTGISDTFLFLQQLAVFSLCTSSHSPLHTLLPLRCALPFAELPHTQAALGMGGTSSLCHPGPAGCGAVPLQHKVLTVHQVLQLVLQYNVGNYALGFLKEQDGQRGKGEGPHADEMKSTVIFPIF